MIKHQSSKDQRTKIQILVRQVTVHLENVGCITKQMLMTNKSSQPLNLTGSPDAEGTNKSSHSLTLAGRLKSSRNADAEWTNKPSHSLNLASKLTIKNESSLHSDS